MNKKKNARVQMATILTSGVLLLTIGIFFSTMNDGLKNKNWQNKTTEKITRVMSFNAASVNGEIITIDKVHRDTDVLIHYYKSEGQEESIDIKDLQGDALERLIRGAIVRQEADARGIMIDDASIEKEIANIIAGSGSEEVVVEKLNDAYGWTLDDFKREVITPYLYEQRLATALMEDEDMKVENKNRAEEILIRVREEGADFGEIAKEYSDDVNSAHNGGDLGWINKDLEGAEVFAEAVFALEQGQISELIETQFGYHIAKNNELRKTEEGIDEIKTQHILIRPIDFNSWMEEKLEDDSIIRFMKFEDESEDVAVEESEEDKE